VISVPDGLLLQLKEYLPDDYDALSMYVEALPLSAASPAYPFAGFVVNLCACTWAHRDSGDKNICLVAAFAPLPGADGKPTFTGGHLCLYETGFSFDLQMGDILIFPSCDITHFNRHFEGSRGTLVLHSDRQGDGWVKDALGWGAHFVRHDSSSSHIVQERDGEAGSPDGSPQV
jgi:hypothetical protein